MIEDLIEKAKQYKIALGLGLLGAIAAGFILLQGRDQGGDRCSAIDRANFFL